MTRSLAMFSLFRRTDVELLYSGLYDEVSFYTRFKDIKQARKSVLMESPYLTIRRAVQFASIAAKVSRKGVSIKVFTRYPGHHTPRLRAEAEEVIGILQDAGIRVFISHDLRHRKIAIIDNTVLYEGSLNILSQSKSREVMRRTISSKLCRQVLAFTMPHK
jgi:hypothetical protein